MTTTPLAPRPSAVQTTPAVDIAYRRRIWRLFAATSILTVFDAAASWLSITHLKIAVEGNGILGAIAAVIGFEGALIVRVIWGIGLALVLAEFALRLNTARRRNLAHWGLVIVTGVLGVLAAWHVLGLVLAFGSI